MRRNLVTGIAIVLLVILSGALFVRERCRLGYLRLEICTAIGMSPVGGPFRQPNKRGVDRRP